ncbi:MAG: ribonuclease P protein component [Labilithrix sp.]|nr:ribonuclease P protein component [Labilithrix sp.]
MSLAFGKDRRIRRRSDFVRVQDGGLRAQSAHFVFLVAPRAPDRDCPEPRNACARLGIVTTRKVGNAVCRNRIKRLVRECFRLWPDFVPDGVDLVVIARAGAHELTLAEVRSEWQRTRRKLLERCTAALEAVS